MDDKGCIYYIFCKETGKGYVGLHCQPTPEKRYNRHWRCAINNSHLCIHRAMRKYGPDAFTVETLCVVPHDALPRMEEYWAEQLETYIWDNPGGYNMACCGGKPNIGRSLSFETKEKLKQYNTLPVQPKIKDNIRFPKSEEHKEKLRQAALLRDPKSRDSVRQPKTLETKEKMRNAALLREERKRQAKLMIEQES